MRNRFFIRLFLLLGLACKGDTLDLSRIEKAAVSSSIRSIDSLRNSERINIFRQRLKFLDEKTSLWEDIKLIAINAGAIINFFFIIIAYQSY